MRSWADTCLGAAQPPGQPWGSKFSQWEWGWGWTRAGCFLLVPSPPPEPWLEGVRQDCTEGLQGELEIAMQGVGRELLVGAPQWKGLEAEQTWASWEAE